MKKQKSLLSTEPRRNFLKLLFTGGAVAYATRLSASEAPLQTDKGDLESRKPSGYRLTRHIQKYYRRAEF